jgi:hypothetical protein
VDWRMFHFPEKSYKRWQDLYRENYQVSWRYFQKLKEQRCSMLTDWKMYWEDCHEVSYRPNTNQRISQKNFS